MSLYGAANHASICPVHHRCSAETPMTDIAQFPNQSTDLAAVDGCSENGRVRLSSGENPPKVRQWHTDEGHGVPMGTIISRKRKDGTMGHRAQIVRKEGRKVVWRESQTFDRRPAALAWLARREEELAQPGAMERRDDPPLRDVIDRYISEYERAMGRTKAQVLRTIKNMDIGELRCSRITSADLVAFAQGLSVEPATRQNYLSHLSSIFSIARPAWGYPLSDVVMKDAFKVTGRLGITGKSRRRERRPSLDELGRLIEHFEKVKIVRPTSIPMRHVICFAIFSTRRQDEITRLRWADFDPAHKRIMVRDMKHPGDKAGNNVWVNLPEEAIAFIRARPRKGELIFPYSSEAISATFTKACKALGIEDLRFHDLRHEGASWLFERGGLDIPQVALITGHRGWSSLQRYSHIRQTGDKYEGWKWRTP